MNHLGRPASRRVIALDVGGTHSRVALIEDGRIIERAQRSTPARHGPPAVVAALDELLAPWRAEPSLPIGVAIAGVVAGPGVTAHAGLPGWNAYPLAARLGELHQRPVHVINDARAAAWGEYCHGAGRGCSEFCFVTVSTGVGAGLVLDGRLHRARNGLEAELGETLTTDGRPMEDLASGTALDRAAREMGLANASALCDAADNGHPAAAAALQQAVSILAAKLADLTVLLGITRSAIGGGLGLRPGYLDRLQQAMQTLPPLCRHELVPAALGADAGLLGVAAWLARA
ncbi:ROK family protein [Ideonella sp. DXS29W]|uniref:ROK family protein n=1 Tax=Ideonella lacteola TaxID=2984193 RepID=A0ABU9BUX9_9BURK